MTIGPINWASMQAPRLGATPIRGPTSFHTWETGITIRAKLALVYDGATLLREVRDGTFSIPKHKYSSVIVDPISDVTVYGTSAGSSGGRYCRYLINRGGIPVSACWFQHSQYMGPTPLAEYIRLSRFTLEGPNIQGQGVVAPTIEPFAAGVGGLYNYAVDGVDVIEEGRRPAAWFGLDSGMLSTLNTAGADAMWWYVFVANLALGYEERQCRAQLTMGTGTAGAPVPQVKAVWWLGDSHHEQNSVSQYMCAFEFSGPLTVMDFRLLYPPFTGVDITPNASYQVYAIPITHLVSRGIELHESATLSNIDAANKGGQVHP